MKRGEGLVWLERRILHTVLLRPSALNDMALQPEHFTTEANAHLFEFVLQANLDSPTDFINIAEMAERNGKPHIGALAAGIACDRDLWPCTNLPADCRTILDAWRTREASRIATELADDCASRDDSAIDKAISSLMALHAQERSYEHTAKSALQGAWNEVMAAHEAGGRLIGVSTGLHDLDDTLGGLHNSDLIVIGARPAMGKTGLLLGMTLAASDGGPVGLISGEQPHEQIGLRWMAAGSNVSVGKLRAAKIEDEQWAGLTAAVSRYSDAPIRILDRSSPDITEVVRIARQWKHQHNIRALYVDYLQRLEIKALAKAPKHERVGAIAKALKNLARDLRIPVIALAQVSRKVDEIASGRPRMSDLSDSSEIEKEADQVMMLWRDLSNPQAEFAPAEINVVKNRHGNIGTVHCRWHGGSTSFQGITRGFAP